MQRRTVRIPFVASLVFALSLVTASPTFARDSSDLSRDDRESESSEIDTSDLTREFFLNLTKDVRKEAKFYFESAEGHDEIVTVSYRRDGKADVFDEVDESGEVVASAHGKKVGKRLEVTLYSEDLAQIGTIKQVFNAKFKKSTYAFLDKDKQKVGRALRVENKDKEIEFFVWDMDKRLIAHMTNHVDPDKDEEGEKRWKIAVMDEEPLPVDLRMLRFLASFQSWEEYGKVLNYDFRKKLALTVLAGTAATGAAAYVYTYGAPMSYETAQWLYEEFKTYFSSFFFKGIPATARAVATGVRGIFYGISKIPDGIDAAIEMAPGIPGNVTRLVTEGTHMVGGAAGHLVSTLAVGGGTGLLSGVTGGALNQAVEVVKAHPVRVGGGVLVAGGLVTFSSVKKFSDYMKDTFIWYVLGLGGAAAAGANPAADLLTQITALQAAQSALNGVSLRAGTMPIIQQGIADLLNIHQGIQAGLPADAATLTNYANRLRGVTDTLWRTMTAIGRAVKDNEPFQEIVPNLKGALDGVSSIATRLTQAASVPSARRPGLMGALAGYGMTIAGDPMVRRGAGLAVVGTLGWVFWDSLKMAGSQSFEWASDQVSSLFASGAPTPALP